MTTIVALFRLKPSIGYFFGSTFFFELGGWIDSVILPILLFQATHNPKSLSLFFILRWLPRFLAAFVSGSITDRYDSKAVLFWTTVSRLVLTAGLFLLFWGGHPIILIFLLLFLLRAVIVIKNPARKSYLTIKTKKESYPLVNSLDQMMLFAAMILGPLIATGLASRTAPLNVLFLTMLSLVVSTVALTKCERAPAAAGTAPVHIATDFKAGLTALWRRRLLAVQIITLAVVVLPPAFVEPFFLPLLSSWLSAANSQLGLIYSGIGVGIVVGITISSWIIRRARNLAVLIFVMYLASILAVLLVSFVPSLFFLTLLLALNGLTGVVGDLALTNSIQRQFRADSRRYLGRIFSLFDIFTFVGQGLGVFLTLFVVVDQLRAAILVVSLVATAFFLLAFGLMAFFSSPNPL